MVGLSPCGGGYCMVTVTIGCNQLPGAQWEKHGRGCIKSRIKSRKKIKIKTIIGPDRIAQSVHEPSAPCS
jgi:hypothetical protein